MSVAVALDGAHQAVRHLPDSITFISPPPGLGTHVGFSATALDGDGFMVTLRAVHDSQVRLFTVSPTAFFPDYAPDVAGEHLAAIGVTDLDEAVVLTVVTRSTDGAFSANLLAPIVVNAMTGAAIQAVLDEDWPLRAPLGSPAAP